MASVVAIRVVMVVAAMETKEVQAADTGVAVVVTRPEAVDSEEVVVDHHRGIAMLPSSSVISEMQINAPLKTSSEAST